MKISKFKLLVIFICIALFIVPFFWLKPGEMDLGGDNSRLYFYDPLNYLFSQTLYSIVSSGVGGEAISYYALPFILFLAVFKAILNSPTLLISAFHGMSLSVALISCYLIIKELLNTKKISYEKKISEYSAILAALFYIFAPYLINGWDKALLTHNQIFLNPLMFFLLLRFILTHNIKYLLGLLLLTFVFAPNFAYIAAPAFFAFYPLSFVFLLIYAKYIRKCAIPVKGLFVGAVLFLLLHAFHLIPQLIALVSPGSGVYEAVFSSESKLSRGLSYFSAIAPNIKVSLNLVSLAQLTESKLPSFIFIAFPVIIFLGFLWNNLWDKRKTMLLTGIFFLIILFFASANITDVGLNFYKALFYIPGFSMFRNFYGQWGFVFVFFYALLLGQSLFVVFRKVKKYDTYLLIVFIAAILITNAWPFINGELVNKTLFQSRNVKIAIRMDPEYEKVLSFIRFLPIDGKVLTLPLNDPGYQILAGKDGGAYQGPSTIAYLTGRNDFSGYNGLSPFSELFLNWAREKDYPSLKRLFSNLNIRYVFYNSDPYIYDDTFPKFPYNYVKNFLPGDQQGYQEFIKQLPVYKIKDFGDKYHIYSVKDDVYLPHIYVASNTVYSSDPLLPYFILKDNGDPRFAVLNIDQAKQDDNIIFKAQNNNPLSNLLNNFHLHRHEPFISRRLDNIFYRFVVLREKFELWRVRNDRDQYLDFSLFYLSKRILEIDTFGEEMSILRSKWLGRGYNSWEASLTRYEQGMKNLIGWIPKSGMSENWQEAAKIKIDEQLFQHQLRLERFIRNSKIKEDDKTYLLSLSKRIFASLFERLALKIYDPFFINYSLNVPKNQSREYEVYVKKEGDIYTDLSKAYVQIDYKILKPDEMSQDGSLVRLTNIEIRDKNNLNFNLHFSSRNLVSDTLWQGSGIVENVTSLSAPTISNITLESSGVFKELTGVRANKQYLISFDYLTYGDDFIFKVNDKRLIKGQKKVARGTYFEKNLNSINWKTHQSVLSFDPNTTAAFMQILSNNDKDISNIAIKNILVTEVPNPTIIFKKILPANSKNETRPKILFTKINPTKYRVKVEQATGPYILVFSEAYNKDWRIYVKDAANPSSTKESIVTSYFNGEVNEKGHKNMFLGKDTFETWRKNSIAENRHFIANGYGANAWKIIPSDVGGKSNYELIIEVDSQRRFYIFLAISALTAVSILISLLFKVFKK